MTDQVPARTTWRGFTVYDKLTDTHGSKVTVQQSSSATDDAVWIFAEHGAPRLPLGDRARLAGAGFDTPLKLAELASMLEPSPHLNVRQAARVRDALDAFISEHQGGES